MYQHVSPICTNNIPINQHVRKVSPIYTNDIPMNQYILLFQRVLNETGTLQRSERGASSIIKSVTKVVRMMTRKGRAHNSHCSKLNLASISDFELDFWTRLNLNISWLSQNSKLVPYQWAHERLVLMVVFDTGPVWHCSEKKYRKYLRWYHRKILR